MVSEESESTGVGEKICMTEEMATSCYGVRVRVVDATGAGLCRRLRDVLAPEFAAADGASAQVSYVVTAGYRVARDGEPIFEAESDDRLVAALSQDVENAVAQRSREMLFVHAGVVGWRGLAIVVPGRSHTGKSTLIGELVRRGAVYWSDEFAVLDDAGRVHPYRRPLVPRGLTAPPPDLRLVRADPPEPLPIGLVVAGPHQPGAAWRPAIVRGARAVLPLVDGTVQAREQSARMLRIAARVAPDVVTLQGPRPEASEVAAVLLDLVDDALVSHALGADGESLSADLGRVAERRFQSRAARPAPTERRLEVTRWVRMTDFLDPAEHRRLLEHVLAHQDDFGASGVVGRQGELGVVDYGARKSRTLSGPPLDAMWDMFERRLAGVLPAVRRELGMPWFPPGKIERQLTVHGGGDFFVPHTDTGSTTAASRRISCVYYFHASPQRFTGGELRLYDTWVSPLGTTGAPTHTTLAPIDNSIVFFPAGAFHEVCPVHGDAGFADGRFSVTIWFHEGKRPEALDGATPAANSTRS